MVTNKITLGYIRPTLELPGVVSSLGRTDVPKAFRCIFHDCVRFDRQERPLFPQVRAPRTFNIMTRMDSILQ